MKGNRLTILYAGGDESFPAVENALMEPAGLLAAGGDLSVARLLEAYRHGIFPWFSHGDPILWWSPDPRMVFATDKLHISTKLRRWLKHCDWTIRADTAFVDVMRACAQPRPSQPNTWITHEMIAAYTDLHKLGHAHSVEILDGAELIGGIYGIAIGHMFFGESMFSRATNASKVALIALCRGLKLWGFPLLDAQVTSAHLLTLGAFEMPRIEFSAHLAMACDQSSPVGSWRDSWPAMTPKDLVWNPPPL
ncbi:MAG: leucyl/phenylalanyl-tRNA--protein transferase [Rudaea sp.]